MEPGSIPGLMNVEERMLFFCAKFLASKKDVNTRGMHHRYEPAFQKPTSSLK